MAQMMDQQAWLGNIGKEAFDLLEEHDRSSSRKGRPKKTTTTTAAVNRRSPAAGGSRPEPKNCNYQYHPIQPPLVYEVNPLTATHEEVIMNSYDAMVMYDGRLVMDYSKKKSTAMAY